MSEDNKRKRGQSSLDKQNSKMKLRRKEGKEEKIIINDLKEVEDESDEDKIPYYYKKQGTPKRLAEMPASKNFHAGN